MELPDLKGVAPYDLILSLDGVRWHRISSRRHSTLRGAIQFQTWQNLIFPFGKDTSEVGNNEVHQCEIPEASGPLGDERYIEVGAGASYTVLLQSDDMFITVGNNAAWQGTCDRRNSVHYCW